MNLFESNFLYFSGTIRGWEGEELMTLGEILHMGSVTVGPVDQKDRYFVLFPSTLLILSVSARMSGFIYEVGLHEIPDFWNVLHFFHPFISRENHRVTLHVSRYCSYSLKSLDR